MLIHLEKLGKTFGEKVVLHDVTASLEELYPLVMEQEELPNVGLKNRRHQC